MSSLCRVLLSCQVVISGQILSHKRLLEYAATARVSHPHSHNDVCCFFWACLLWQLFVAGDQDVVGAYATDLCFFNAVTQCRQSLTSHLYCLLQEMRLLLEPMSIMFASKGYKLDDVIQEVRRMQSGWQHSDYRAWLKHYTTGKRPRSVLEDSKQLLRHDGGDDGAGPRDMGTG